MTEQTPAVETPDVPVLATITYGDVEFDVTRKPSVFLIAELAHTDSEGAALGVIHEFYSRVMSPAEFKRFRAVALDDEREPDVVVVELQKGIESTIEATMGRPTK